MKKLNNIFKSATLIAAAACLTTSCDDWLTIYPQDKVVEEEFWEDKSDLEGVRYAAYRSMIGNMSKYYIWGDLRSDVYMLNPSEPRDSKETRLRYQKIIQAMPDSSMSEFDWGGAYRTINYCNKVLSHGPEILEKDKQFTSTEWRQMRAEMVGLRALNYFYLLRAFKDIPYTTKVINSDAEVERFGLTPQLAVLDSCISSIEGNPYVPGSGVLGQARNRFANKADTKGMITNSAIYVMLADMYLWRASLHEGRLGKRTLPSNMVLGTDTIKHTPESDYIAAAIYADEAMAALKRQNDEEYKGFGSNSALFEDFNLADYGMNNAELLTNDFPASFTSVNNTNVKLPVMESMYTKGNCRESIFELQINQSDGTANDIINDLFTKGTDNQLAVSQEAIDNVYKNKDLMELDTRILAGANNRIAEKNSSGFFSPISQALPGRYCSKFADPELYLKDENGDKQPTLGYRSDNRRNFIIYRMTDAMLIKAEAAAIVGNKFSGYPNVAKICNALRRRAYIPYTRDAKAYSKDLSKSVEYDADQTGKTSSNIDIVMNERMIEFIGEGKRWFDLVRFAERNASVSDTELKKVIEGSVAFEGYDERESTEENPVKDGARGVAYMMGKYMKVSQSSFYKTLINRTKNRYGLYCPIHEMEVKASMGLIPQNPVWNKSKYDK